MTDLEMLEKMFKKQDELNIQTNGQDWGYNKDLLWYRAVWTECAEMMEHTSFKWWKKESIDLENIKLEIIDIYHFIMSDLLVSIKRNIIEPEKSFDMKLEFVSNNILKIFSSCSSHRPEFNVKDFRNIIETLAKDSLEDKGMCIEELRSFIYLVCMMDMKIEDLFKLYMGKNILNAFRQNNNYKTGGYIKIWKDNKEDNYYLNEILDAIKVINDDKIFEDSVYSSLESLYQEVLIRHNVPE
jgi:dimeric dUTPase (all-alpha-NTP-PPase superfamily)